MEITGIALQTVAAGEDVAFTETPVCGSKCIVHRQGSGIIKLRGITNQCKANGIKLLKLKVIMILRALCFIWSGKDITAKGFIFQDDTPLK